MVARQHYRWDFIGLSTGNKPTPATSEKVVDGSTFYCSDNSKLYVWYNDQWYEKVVSGGGPSVVQTTGTSTTDVMSQNATAGMVFADPVNRHSIAIGSRSTTLNYGVSVGFNTRNKGGVSVGYNADSGMSSVSVGEYASTTKGNASVAIGAESSVQGVGTIAIGSHSSATTRGEMNIGSTSTSYGYNNSNYRLLTGLYDGQSAHDAATVGQITPTTDSSAPTSATAGRLGEIRIDTTTNTAYMCVLSDSATPTYEWKQITA